MSQRGGLRRPLPRGGRTNRITGAIPTLDLHGLRLESAIHRVTNFLEENKSRDVVRIITGAGSHSLDGPVLKPAVQGLLERRQMTFYQDSPGCFTVRCDTGVAFYREITPLDTKLIVVENPSNTNLPMAIPIRPTSSLGFNVPSASTVPVASLAPMDAECTVSESSSSETSVSAAHLRRCVSLGARLTPAEINWEDSQLIHAREESLEASLVDQRQIQRDQEAVERAIRLSQQELENEQAQEEALMSRALTASEREQQNTSAQANENEDDLLQQVLEASAKEQDQAQQEEERLLRQVMEESEREATQLEELSESELDQALREALSRSVRENLQPNAEEEEERLLREVMALSLEN